MKVALNDVINVCASKEFIKAYEENLIDEQILEGLNDLENGKIIDGETAFKMIKEKYGYKV